MTNYSLRSPITVNLDPISGLDRIVKPTDAVRNGRNQIDIGSEISIAISKALRFHSRSGISTDSSAKLSTMGTAIRTASIILKIVDATQSVLDPNSLAHGGTRAFVVNGVLTLGHPDSEKQFREAALRIVGLGSGFTPSGDDMLGGFLAAYNSLAATVDRARILLDLSQLKGKTSWVSAKLLDYMQRLVLDEQMSCIIDAAAEGNEDALVAGFESLLPRGHTSGIDISVGAILAFSLLRDVGFEKNETEAIAGLLGLLS